MSMLPFSSLSEVHFIWPVVSSILVFLLSVKAVQWILTDTSVSVRNASKDHNWRSVQILAKPYYCSVCEALMINGLGSFCDYCGVYADEACVKKAGRLLPCKNVYTEKKLISHHWIKGNLPLGAICDVCEEECCMEPGLIDFKCCWCQRTVHTMCKNDLSEICDLGPWRQLIVPPWSIHVKGKNQNIQHYQIESISHPGWADWIPLLVIANCKSGNSDGDRVLSIFRHILNPAQVIDLDDKPSLIVLKWAPLLNEAFRRNYSRTGNSIVLSENSLDSINAEDSNFSIVDITQTCRFLVAGGDGTVAWILNDIHKLGIKPAPAISIFPLGTGNDLSRVLGWGKENSPEFDPNVILQKVLNSSIEMLDRWNIEIKPHSHLGLRMSKKSLFMYNYFSVGVDAQVTLNFHRTRESFLYVFSSRAFNKLLYLLFGTQQTFASSCPNLQDQIDLYMDGLRVELPSLESIVVLNIPSWGAGVPLWSMGADEDTPAQSINDKKLEVVGIYSSFHIAQLQVGLSKPYRIGQARTVEINLKEKTPVQVDGEPWEQHSSYITIKHVDQAAMLKSFS